MQVRELTSAEAGFLYGAELAEASNRAAERVDELVSPPLRNALEEATDQTIEKSGEALNRVRLRGWLDDGAPGASEALQRRIERALERIDGSGDERAAIERRLGRMEIAGAVADLGGDVSSPSANALDLRRLIETAKAQELGLELVIVGGILLGSLDRTAIRRRLASLFRNLPPAVCDEIRDGLDGAPVLDDQVDRRIYEAYAQIAGEGHRTDEECALLGLFFVVSAGVFRHNRMLTRLENELPESLVEAARRYRRACLKSGKPELSPKIAKTLAAILDERRHNGKGDERAGGADE